MQQALRCRVPLSSKFSSSQRKMHQASPVPTAMTLVLFLRTLMWVVTDPFNAHSQRRTPAVCVPILQSTHLLTECKYTPVCVFMCVYVYTHGT